MDNTIGKSIDDAIIIDDDTDNDPEPMDQQECPPVPEDVPDDVKFPVDTPLEDPEKLWREWTKNNEAIRKESEIKTRELEEDSKIKTKVQDEPEPKRATFIETVEQEDGTIHRREVCKEEDLVEMVCCFIMAEKSMEEWNARYQAHRSLLSRLPQMKEELVDGQP
jgi:hypothetical protein